MTLHSKEPYIGGPYKRNALYKGAIAYVTMPRLYTFTANSITQRQNCDQIIAPQVQATLCSGRIKPSSSLGSAGNVENEGEAGQSSLSSFLMAALSFRRCIYFDEDKWHLWRRRRRHSRKRSRTTRTSRRSSSVGIGNHSNRHCRSVKLRHHRWQSVPVLLSLTLFASPVPSTFCVAT